MREKEGVRGGSMGFSRVEGVGRGPGAADGVGGRPLPGRPVSGGGTMREKEGVRGGTMGFSRVEGVGRGPGAADGVGGRPLPGRPLSSTASVLGAPTGVV